MRVNSGFLFYLGPRLTCWFIVDRLSSKVNISSAIHNLSVFIYDYREKICTIQLKSSALIWKSWLLFTNLDQPHIKFKWHCKIIFSLASTSFIATLVQPLIHKQVTFWNFGLAPSYFAPYILHQEAYTIYQDTLFNLNLLELHITCCQLFTQNLGSKCPSSNSSEPNCPAIMSWSTTRSATRLDEKR